jgi:hypothetical protein
VNFIDVRHVCFGKYLVLFEADLAVLYTCLIIQSRAMCLRLVIACEE